MSSRIVLLGLLAWSGIAGAKGAPSLPFTPGAYLVDGKSDGVCREGPGGKSLIVEDDQAMLVITGDDAKVHVDRFGADRMLRLDGRIEGNTLSASSGGEKLTIKQDKDAIVVQLGDKPAQRWTRTTPATGGVATGIGGVFFKAKDPKKLRDWYVQHLGFSPSQYGFVDLRWRELGDPQHIGQTVWAIFKTQSTHFDGPFMINYRVDKLDAVLAKLEKDGIKPERKEDEPGNGRFAWVRDGEGNLVELWEPPPGG